MTDGPAQAHAPLADPACLTALVTHMGGALLPVSPSPCGSLTPSTYWPDGSVVAPPVFLLWWSQVSTKFHRQLSQLMGEISRTQVGRLTDRRPVEYQRPRWGYRAR